MSRVKLRNVNRPKALLGALIGAVGQGLNAYAQYQSSKAQADAIERQAQMQVDAMNSINENNNKLQEQLIASQKENNQRMVDAYLNAAMQAGNQNVNERLRMSRIQVRNGGGVKRKLRNGYSSLRGMNNNVIEGEGGELIMINSNNPNPFNVTDGGGVVYLGETQDGNQLYQIVGDTHKQTHIAPDGKRKTGVGIKINNGTDAAFISKHNINGINPTEEVMNGMSPELAFAIQEESKTPVRRRLSCGGRRRAWDGGPFSISLGNYNLTGNGFSLPDNWNKDNNDYKPKWYNTPLGGAALTGGINFLGWIPTMIGNALGAKYMKSGVNNAANALINAADKLSGIDVNSVNLKHGVAALQDPTVAMGAERAAAERNLHRSLKNINRGTLSSAAAQNRYNIVNTNYNDIIGNIASEEFKQRQQILSHNMDAINDMTRTNLSIDAQNANLKSDILKYNNDIRNEAIQLRAQADADRYMKLGEIRNNRSLANWSGLGTVFTNTGKTYQDLLKSDRENRFNVAAAMLGASNQYTIDQVRDILKQFNIYV